MPNILQFLVSRRKPKSLLELAMPPSTSRAIARFLISDVHDGRSTSFWFDNWSPLGPLINVFGTDGNRRLRVRLEASVADACTAHRWRLPHPRSDQEVSLHAFLTNFPLPAIDRGPDVFGWSTNGDINHSFSSAKTWEVLRHRAHPPPTVCKVHLVQLCNA